MIVSVINFIALDLEMCVSCIALAPEEICSNELLRNSRSRKDFHVAVVVLRPARICFRKRDSASHRLTHFSLERR